MIKKLKIKSFINTEENVNDFVCKILKKMKDKWFEANEPKVGMLDISFKQQSRDWVIFEHPDKDYLNLFIKTFKSKLVKLVKQKVKS